MFDKQRIFASEDSINISYKLPRTEEVTSSREPMMTRLRRSKELWNLQLIQRFRSDNKEDFFGILRPRLFPDSTVQFLAVEEDFEVHNFN